ncbi:MAG: hypothetical protein Q7U98_03110 [Methylicorpusculum sp.]|uniref:hypothetical protein n=1 Tax=Methylicorpusculum sp. TaxID=2713644 RepID=UPI002719C903|nr:hypothetical protein [Methylicorpusculum sp.]MDO8843717.1 hypothetical protein [Methylicorpusculum sp.]MDO8938131.1 hypothetical protein [Methylicorpusculum sp.]MDO9240676.1 hypothetical protein [Methylicorpusculum sp.]MDP2204195.1 hypothetical protein [Methylicorpusculum sp.]
MYDHINHFRQDALECGTDYYSDDSLKPQNIDTAFKIYQHARQGTTLLDADGNTIAFGVTIVGRLALRVSVRKDNGEKEFTWVPSDESFPSIDAIMKENLGTLAEESTGPIGSILDTRNWSLLANDAWLLGSLQALTEFHFASPLSWSNLWDDTMKRITVTAREVIGISTHGYEIRRPNPKLEAVAICIDKNKALAASLISYKDRVKRYGNPDGLKSLLKIQG